MKDGQSNGWMPREMNESECPRIETGACVVLLLALV